MSESFDRRRARLSLLMSAVMIVAACGGSEQGDPPANTAEPSGEAGQEVVPADAMFDEGVIEESKGSVPPLGTTSIRPDIKSLPGGTAEAFKFKSRSALTAQSVQLYLDAGNTADEVVVGIYAATSSGPGALLSKGVIERPVPGAWNGASLTPFALKKGVEYWVAVMAPAGSGELEYRAFATGGSSVTSASAGLTTVPDAWATGQTKGSASMSMYLSGDAGSPPRLRLLRHRRLLRRRLLRHHRLLRHRLLRRRRRRRRRRLHPHQPLRLRLRSSAGARHRARALPVTACTTAPRRAITARSRVKASRSEPRPVTASPAFRAGARTISRLRPSTVRATKAATRTKPSSKSNEPAHYAATLRP